MEALGTCTCMDVYERVHKMELGVPFLKVIIYYHLSFCEIDI